MKEKGRGYCAGGLCRPRKGALCLKAHGSNKTSTFFPERERTVLRNACLSIMQFFPLFFKKLAFPYPTVYLLIREKFYPFFFLLSFFAFFESTMLPLFIKYHEFSFHYAINHFKKRNKLALPWAIWYYSYTRVKSGQRPTTQGRHFI